MTILLFGADGQVGWELQRSLSIHGTVMPLTQQQVDLTDTQAIRTSIRNARPGAIVNAAAYTAVDKAETDTDRAFAVNAAAPEVMAAEAKAAGIPLIHYSTDYVYDGSKSSAYTENDTTNPQSAYGRSKLAGDEAIVASGARAIILRTSWVYAARGANFVRTILRLANERDSLRVVSDQVGAPTSAELLADVTAQILVHINSRKTDLAAMSPLYHCAAAGETSWHGFASFIVEEAAKLGANLKLTAEKIEAITTAQYPTPAARPKNSRLDCAKLERTFGLQLPAWQWHSQRALREIVQP